VRRQIHRKENAAAGAPGGGESGRGFLPYGSTVILAVFVTPLARAWMSAVLVAETVEVFTWKVAVLVPAGRVTLLTAGVATAVLLDDRATVIEPGAAGHSSVTVAVDVAGPRSRLGDSVRLAIAIGRTLMLSVFVTPPALALTVPVTVEVTTGPEMVKVALVAPAGTVTPLGIVATGCWLTICTQAPPAGAGAASVTFPTEVLQPPGKLRGVAVKDCSTAEGGGGEGGFATVSDASFATPP
jgi:hypothetical protein